MLLIPIASSSAGNAYEVWDGQTRLLLECGLPLRKLQRLTKRSLAEYAACLVTHEHKDHSASACDLLARSVSCFMTTGTAAALGVEGRSALRTVEIGKRYEIGSYYIKAFATVHDCAEPCGWLIKSRATGETLVFATDTAYVRYRFKGLTEIAVECNYLDDQIDQSELHPSIIARIKATHLSFEQAGRWLVQSDLSRVRKIWLLHLSDRHSRAEMFATAIHKTTGIETVACQAERR
jgi:phosphoribosyl 1,2-cyclic phosphodiesterase